MSSFQSIKPTDDTPEREDQVKEKEITPLRPVESISHNTPRNRNFKNMITQGNKSFSGVVAGMTGNEENAQVVNKQQPKSIFDLAKPIETPEIALTQNELEVPIEEGTGASYPPFQTVHVEKPKNPLDQLPREAIVGLHLEEMYTKKKDAHSIDSSSVCSGSLPQQGGMIQAPPSTPDTIGIESKEKTRKALFDVVDQIVRRLSVVTYQDKTEIIIELKHPPLFQGATLTITEYHQEKKTFNLSFTNLTPEAKQLLDQKLHQEELRNSLEQRSYHLHHVTTHLVYYSETSSSKDSQEHFFSQADGSPNDDRSQGRNKKRSH